MDRLIMAQNDWTGPCLRITIAVVLFPHGAQKLLGWFGGHGYAATMDFLSNTVHLPGLIGTSVIAIEFFGPLFILFGVLSRLWAIGVMFVMAGVIMTVQHQHFFMNWFDDQQGEGMEFFLLVIGLCVALILNGSGRYSFDQRFYNQLYKEK